MFRGLQQNAGDRWCSNARVVEMAKGNAQEVRIPVPWGHIAGRIVVQKCGSLNSQGRG
jgi:plastocyanin domain-containing protein